MEVMVLRHFFFIIKMFIKDSKSYVLIKKEPLMAIGGNDSSS